MWGESGDADYQIGAGEKREGWDLLKPPPPYNRFPLRVGCELREVSRKKEGGM